jgi:FkbM family methyltransferase
MGPVIWIESAPNLLEELRRNVSQFPLQSVMEATLWSKSNVKLKLNISNNSYSSSLLDLDAATRLYPKIKFTKSIDVLTTKIDDLKIPREKMKGGLMVLDLQGVELEALKGATQTLRYFDFILCEVSKVKLYHDQALWSEVDTFLNLNNFKLIDSQFDDKYGWGNALYRRGNRKLFDLVHRRKRRLSRVRFNQLMHKYPL